MQISGHLSKQPFSKVSGRITLKNCLQEYFHLENPKILGYRFLGALLLICRFLLFYHFVMLC